MRIGAALVTYFLDAKTLKPHPETKDLGWYENTPVGLLHAISRVNWLIQLPGGSLGDKTFAAYQQEECSSAYVIAYRKCTFNCSTWGWLHECDELRSSRNNMVNCLAEHLVFLKYPWLEGIIHRRKGSAML